MTIDLRQCSSQRKAPINGRTLAAPLIAYKALTLPTEPINEGAFRALKIEIQEGNYMMATYPEVECIVKYHGYIERQLREIERSHELEMVSLPPELDYSAMTALSHEVREKLLAVRPTTLGQAARIPGITPAAISILAVHVKRARAQRPRDAASRAG